MSVDYSEVLNDLIAKRKDAERQVEKFNQAIAVITEVIQTQGSFTLTGVPDTGRDFVRPRAPREGTITLGDGAEKILQEAGKPLHINSIVVGLTKLGRMTSVKSLSSTLIGDPRKRFILLGNNTFNLRERLAEAAKESADNQNA